MPTTDCDRLDLFCQIDGDWTIGNVIGNAGKWWGELTWGTAGEVIKGIANGPLKWLAEEVYQGVDSVLLTLTTFWVGIQTPTGQTWDIQAGVVHRYTTWLVLTLAIVSIIVAGILMIRDGRGEPLGKLVQSLIIMVIASGSGVYLAGIVVQIADGTAEWVIDQVIEYSNGSFFLVITGFASLGGGLTAIIVIFFGVIQIILGVVQVVLMFMRTALLLLLAGTIPLAFSITNTSWGAGWASKVVAWFLAFALYKPAAALVYATGITITSSVLDRLADNPGDSVLMLVNGLMIMATAVLALPALMKLIVPAVGTMAAGSGGAVIAGGIGAAMGAKSIAGGIGGGAGDASAGGGGGGGPSGAGDAGTSAGGTANTAGAAGAASTAGSAAAGAATGGLATAAEMAGEKAQEGAQAAEGAVNTAATDPTGAENAEPNASADGTANTANTAGAAGAASTAGSAAAGAATGGLATAAEMAGEKAQDGAQAATGAVNTAATHPTGADTPSGTSSPPPAPSGADTAATPAGASDPSQDEGPQGSRQVPQ